MCSVLHKILKYVRTKNYSKTIKHDGIVGVDPGSFKGGSNQDTHTYFSYAKLNYSYETEQKPKEIVLLQL